MNQEPPKYGQKRWRFSVSSDHSPDFVIQVSKLFWLTIRFLAVNTALDHYHNIVKRYDNVVLELIRAICKDTLALTVIPGYKKTT